MKRLRGKPVRGYQITRKQWPTRLFQVLQLVQVGAVIPLLVVSHLLHTREAKGTPALEPASQWDINQHCHKPHPQPPTWTTPPYHSLPYSTHLLYVPLSPLPYTNPRVSFSAWEGKNCGINEGAIEYVIAEFCGVLVHLVALTLSPIFLNDLVGSHRNLQSM